MIVSTTGNTDELRSILSQGMVDVNHEDLRNCPDINYREDAGIIEYKGCQATPLKTASSRGHKAMVELLLEAGADQLITILLLSFLV